MIPFFYIYMLKNGVPLLCGFMPSYEYMEKVRYDLFNIVKIL